MTAATAKSHPGLLVAGVERGTRTFAEGIRLSWARSKAYRETLAELRALTDRDLSDIGIARGSLAEFARRAVYGNS